MSSDRTAKARSFLQKVLPGNTLEALPERRDGGGLESLAPRARADDPLRDAAESAATKLKSGQDLAPIEQFALEAIIIPDQRPAVDIVGGDYTVVHPLWMHFMQEPIRSNLRKTFASIGRIELPHHPTLPYGGTGFVVGRDLLMTNRHVAEIFSSGLGARNLVFRQGLGAGIDFLRERDSPPEGTVVAVRAVAMIHPYWDMALLRVEGLDAGHVPLSLSLKQPEELAGRDIAVVGYPAFDPRNAVDVQNKVFGGVYYIKRLQPGKLNGRDQVDSFGKTVAAATHDSSTLGGNSGSAVIDVLTGQVVGLHFAGLYLKSNYAVPTAELARDGHVDALDLAFEAPPRAEAGLWQSWWEPTEAAAPTAVVKAPDVGRPPPAGPAVPPSSTGGGHPPPPAAHPAGEVARWTVPIEITIRVGDATRTADGGPARAVTAEAAAGVPGAPVAGRLAADVPIVQPGPRPAGDTSLRPLDAGPLTFRDHFLSLYQPAAAEVARAQAQEPAATRGLESLGDTPGETIRAAERVAQARMAGLKGPAPAATALETMSALDHGTTCASLALQLLEAKITGDSRTGARLEGELTGGTCDPRWARTISAYVGYFGPGGARREPLYVTPAQAGEGAIPIKAGARVALIADWGTGAEPARRILRQVRDQNPDVLVHLGDIYYSGTTDECRVNFEALVEEVFGPPARRIPVFTLAGNHDMYCGGVGYYDLIQRLNAGPAAQRASFFCLRGADNAWQLLAMDTGRHDYHPLAVTDAVTFVEPEEEQWLRRRVEEFPGRTILLSHHQLFSAFSAIGKADANGRTNPCNPKLLQTFETLRAGGKAIPAWFWGHEHNLCIYQSFAGLERGRCVGHGAIPVFAADDPYAPLSGLDSVPQLVGNTRLSVAGNVFTHGFAMLALDAGRATATYFEDWNGTARLLYSETM